MGISVEVLMFNEGQAELPAPGSYWIKPSKPWAAFPLPERRSLASEDGLMGCRTGRLSN
jgi:hypothetical protein